MKIALISNDYPRKGHPRYTFVQELVNTLVDMGVEISVIAPQSLTHKIIRREQIFPKKEKYKTKLGKEYIVYRPYDISFGKKLSSLKSFTDFICDNSIRKILNQIKPDVLYGHFWHIAYRFKNYAKHNKLPLFVACGEGDNAMETLVSELGALKVKDFHDTVTGVISVSSENARKSMAFGLAEKENIIVLPNAVDDVYFMPKESSVRDELGIKDDEFLILFVGVFNERKGANRLSAAIERLNDPQIKAIYIGKPSKGDEALPYGSGIVYCGSLDHDQLPDYYNAANVFILPTQKEGCCNAIVESLACGVPVLSANRSFNDDILNQSNSITVDPDNVNEIAEAIRRIKNDKVFYNSLKSYTLSHSNEYSIQVRAKRIIDFIYSKINA